MVKLKFSFAHLRKLYFEGKDVFSLKAIFKNQINENLYLNGIIKCGTDQIPYYGMGIKFLKNNPKNDLCYSFFLNNKYALKADITLGFENHSFVYGLNVVKNIPFPYVNFIYNSKE